MTINSPPQMAPGSTQPFCYNTLSGRPTDRPTLRSRRETCTKSVYARERRTKNTSERVVFIFKE